MYAAVNARFAEAVCEEVDSDSPLVLVQDYHFALAPRLIRDALPQSTIVAFWHIPWPHWRDFEICPWGRQLLDGLLGSSIVGFQTALDCRNFAETAERVLGAHVNRAQNVITYEGRRTMVRAYPVSVEWPSRWAADAPAIETCRETVRRQLHLPPDVRLGVGVDRLDYTKGINEKFLAVERLLDSHPGAQGALRLRPDCRTEPRVAAGLSRAPGASGGNGRSHQPAIRHGRVTARSFSSRRITSRRTCTGSFGRPISATSAAFTTA